MLSATLMRLGWRCGRWVLPVIALAWSATVRADATSDFIAAAADGDLAQVQRLMASGADVNARQKDGEAALLLAALNGHRAVVVALLEKGADVDVKWNDGWTALMAASRGGHREIVRVLLSKGADVNAEASRGWTALKVAALNGHLDIVQALLGKGADVNGKTDGGMTALMLASKGGHPEVVAALLATGADSDSQSDSGQTALSIAEKDGNTEVVEALRRGGEHSHTKPAVAASAAEGKTSGDTSPSAAAETGPTGAVVNIKTLNVREGPATPFAKVGALKQGEQLDVLGKLKDCSWLKVRSRTRSVAGWVSAEKGNLNLSGTCEDIPEAAVQPQ